MSEKKKEEKREEKKEKGVDVSTEGCLLLAGVALLLILFVFLPLFNWILRGMRA